MKLHNWAILFLGLLTVGGIGSNGWNHHCTLDSNMQKQGWKPTVSGFTHLREELFSCGGVTRTVQVYLHEKSGLEFVLVPGGSFDMGSRWNEKGRDNDEGPRRRVAVKPYLICRTECTQAAWDRIGGADYRTTRGDALPIEGIRWDDCADWCRRAGLRLPSEAEWEYACRAGTDSRFSFGNSRKELDSYAWSRGNSEGRPHPVGKKKFNALGLFDMHGNVWELCQGRHSSGHHVKRGGCFLSIEDDYLRSANRGKSSAHHHSGHLGFRPACTIPSP